MSNKAQVIQALVSGIKQDIVHFNRYHELLQQQQQLMQRHDSEQLVTLNLRHHKYHDALIAQAKKRQQLLVSLGLTGDENGIERVIAALNPPSAIKLRQLWQQLVGLMAQCKTQNEINGELLAGQQELLTKITNPEHSNEYYPQPQSGLA